MCKALRTATCNGSTSGLILCSLDITSLAPDELLSPCEAPSQFPRDTLDIVKVRKHIFARASDFLFLEDSFSFLDIDRLQLDAFAKNVHFYGFGASLARKNKMMAAYLLGLVFASWQCWQVSTFLAHSVAFASAEEFSPIPAPALHADSAINPLHGDQQTAQGKALLAFEQLARQYERDYPRTNLTKVYVGTRKNNANIRGLFARMKIEKNDIIAVIPQDLLFPCPARSVPSCVHGFAETLLAADELRKNTRDAAGEHTRTAGGEDTLSVLGHEEKCFDIENTGGVTSASAVATEDPQKTNGTAQMNSTQPPALIASSACKRKSATKQDKTSFLDYANFLPSLEEFQGLWRLPESILKNIQSFSVTFAQALDRQKNMARQKYEKQDASSSMAGPRPHSERQDIPMPDDALLRTTRTVLPHFRSSLSESSVFGCPCTACNARNLET